jgi:hypothetical protein
MTTEEKERYHRLVAVAESVVLQPGYEENAARCELARTIIEVARELRLGTTSRDTSLQAENPKTTRATTRFPRLPE